MARSDEGNFVKRLMEYAPRDDDDDYRASRGRAARAALRRGLGKEAGMALEMIPYVASALPGRRLEDQEEQDYYLVASLFALHPPKQGEVGERGDNFGASMRRLALVLQRRFKRPMVTIAGHAACGDDA